MVATHERLAAGLVIASGLAFGGWLASSPGLFATFLQQKLWPKLEDSAIEILVHLAVTVLTVVSIALIDLILYAFGQDDRVIPGTGTTLSNWLFILEVAAATGIIAVGTLKAVISLMGRKPKAGEAGS